MKKSSKKSPPFPKLDPCEKSIESDIDSFSGNIHVQHFKKVLGDKIGKKCKNVTQIIDVGKKKGNRSHRERNHNRKFISWRFRSNERKVCAYIHLLGDFIQDKLLDIMPEVGEEFKKGKIEGPFYEKDKNGNWGWDIKDKVAQKLIKDISNIFIETLKKRNRVGG